MKFKHFRDAMNDYLDTLDNDEDIKFYATERVVAEGFFQDFGQFYDNDRKIRKAKKLLINAGYTITIRK